MLLPELWELLRAWRSHPPVHIMLLPFWRYFCGVEEENPARPNQQQASRTTTEDAKAVRALAGGNVKSFDQLPLAMQARLKSLKEQKEHGHGAQ